MEKTEPKSEQDLDTRLVPFIGYCPVCDTWTREYHIHELRRAES